MVCKGSWPLKQIVLGVLWHQLLFAVGSADIIDFGRPPHTDSTECSRTCKSEYCSEPPLLKYGKYCGVSYTGCPAEAPCDDIDACCMFHDSCVAASHNDYLSTVCNGNLLNCIEMVKKGGVKKTFEGNTCSTKEVSDVISSVVKAAVAAKRLLNKP